MGRRTGISWAGATWNPWQGCRKKSRACKFCYMFREKRRYGQDPLNVHRSSKATFDAPLGWQREVERGDRHGEGKLVFTCSWSDWFIREADAWRDDAWAIVKACKDLIFQVLTKRHDRIIDHVPWGAGEDPWPNVWLGVSVEDQGWADERIPHLLSVPAAVRFLSCEPLLGPIDLDRWIGVRLYCGSCESVYGLSEAVPDPGGHSHGADCCARCGREGHMLSLWGEDQVDRCVSGARYDADTILAVDEGSQIHQVITGGESGDEPGVEPTHPDWVRSLRDQCQAAGVAFHHKQWGEWLPISEMSEADVERCYHPYSKAERERYGDRCGEFVTRRCRVPTRPVQHDGGDGWRAIDGHCAYQVFRVGKKASGRRLDGREWNEFPTEEPARA